MMMPPLATILIVVAHDGSSVGSHSGRLLLGCWRRRRRKGEDAVPAADSLRSVCSESQGLDGHGFAAGLYPRLQAAHVAIHAFKGMEGHLSRVVARLPACWRSTVLLSEQTELVLAL